MSDIMRRRRSDKSAEPKKKNPALYVLGGLVAILVLAYGIGVYYFSSHFFLNAQINGKEVGGFTLTEAEQVFTQDLDSHVITLIERGKDGVDTTEVIDPEAVKVVINVGTQIKDDLKNQNQWLWFLGLRGKTNKNISLDVTFDEKALEEVVDSLNVFKKENVVAPKNAYIKAGKTKFEIVKEVEGNTIIKKDLLKAIGTAFAQCQNELNLSDANVYEKPHVRSTHPEMNKALKKANKWAASKLTYDFEYRTLVVDYKKFKDWVNISKDYKKVTISDAKLEAYTTKLCRDFNTMGIYRKFKTTGGNTVTITDGDYGWKIYYDKELAQLEKDIKSGKKVKRKPIYSYTAMTRKSATDDIGNSYVEVSISNQMVYLYVKGERILSSSVVTGDTTKGRGTHRGIYSITYKQRNATLGGAGYNYSSKVSYWMPFNGGEGLHDAPWRSSFGGSIYRGSGSHGCVNCPPSVARVLYKYVDEGFPVIVY